MLLALTGTGTLLITATLLLLYTTALLQTAGALLTGVGADELLATVTQLDHESVPVVWTTAEEAEAAELQEAQLSVTVAVVATVSGPQPDGEMTAVLSSMTVVVGLHSTGGGMVFLLTVEVEETAAGEEPQPVGTGVVDGAADELEESDSQPARAVAAKARMRDLYCMVVMVGKMRLV